MLSFDGPEYELLGPLHSDLFFQDKLLMNGVDIKIKLRCSKDSSCLMSSLAAGSCKLFIMGLAICEEGAGGAWSTFGAC